MEVKKFTLITGASRGIGRAFAFECASRGMHLLLVALPDDGLEETKNQIQLQHQVDIVILTLDLREVGAVRGLYDYCVSQNIMVNMLINNAGVGAAGRFEHLPQQVYLDMLHLNIRAVTMLTQSFLPMLKENTPAYILNMSSMEANFPLPYKSVYTGTKNFVFAFSLALREELASSNVMVTVMCPGPVLTNADGLKRINSMGNRAKKIMLMPEEVAKIGISKLIKGQGVVVPGKINWTLFKIMKVMPTNLKMKLLEKLFRVYRDNG
jgi:uncharacterized protein